MRAITGAIVLGLVVLSAFAQGPAPAPTPNPVAASQAQALLALFNKNDQAALRNFLAANTDSTSPQSVPLEQTLRTLAALYRQTGGVEIDGTFPAGPNGAMVKFHVRQGSGVGALFLGVAPNEKHSITRLDVIPFSMLPPPPGAVGPKPFPEVKEGASESDRLKALGDSVSAAAKAGRFSGVVLVAKNGQNLFERAAGQANTDFQVPNRMDTKFLLGSMNKMFTSVAVAQLVQQGKLAYTDPIAKYLQDYPNRENAAKITVHHLLTHTSGLGDFFGPEFDSKKASVTKLEDYYRFFANKPLLFEPGKGSAYSNAGMLLAGLIVQRVSGEDYYDYVRKHVFGPAGMKDSDSDWVWDVVPNLAVGYTRFGSDDILALEPPSRSNILTLPPRGSPAGGGHSTASDLVRFANALESHTLLNAQYTDLITTAKVRDYAYGFEDRRVNGKRVIGHGGGAPGMNAELRIIPELGYVIVVLTNNDPPFASVLSREILDLLTRP